MVAFVIEFKSGSYHLSLIQKQIQTCLIKLQELMDKYSSKIIVKAIFYAPSHIKNIFYYTQAYRVDYMGIKLRMIHLKNGDNILNALRLKSS